MLAHEGEKTAANAVNLTRFYVGKAMHTIEMSARKVIAAVADGDLLRTQMAIVRRLSKHDPVDTIALGRSIAVHLLIAGRYTL
jgi:butyryl-CoA dehydrogenase